MNQEPIEASPGAEEAVLGAFLLEPDLIPEGKETISLADFPKGKTQTIYKAILEMTGPVDPETLSRHLEKTGDLEKIGGRAYLNKLLEQTPTAANWREYAQALKDTARTRELKVFLRENLGALNDSPGEYRALLDKLREGAEDLIRAADLDGKPIPTMREILHEIEEEIFESPFKPIPTFSAGLNRNLNGGLQRGKVFAITGPAGGGKTTFAHQLIDEIARGNKLKGKEEPRNICVYIALEQGRAELLIKSFSRLGRVNGGLFELKEIAPDDPKVKKALEIYANEIAPYLYIIEGAEGSTLRGIRALIRKISSQRKEAHQLVVCIDPFQRLRTGNRDLDSEEISRVGAVATGLKKMAMDLKIAMVLLSDTSKTAAEQAKRGEPSVGAMRGSYMAEHAVDASAMIALKPDGFQQDQLTPGSPYYKLDEWFRHYMGLDEGKEEAAVFAELVFSKQRSGPSFPVPFLYKRALNCFFPAEKIASGEDE